MISFFNLFFTHEHMILLAKLYVNRNHIPLLKTRIKSLVYNSATVAMSKKKNSATVVILFMSRINQ
jgi:hypothetical protein